MSLEPGGWGGGGGGFAGREQGQCNAPSMTERKMDNSDK